ncbi:MAG: hypothetical protein ACI89E_000636, partial [Planctomycetota bacterium]
MKIPEVLLVEVEHAPGSLAKMLTAVGECGVTIEGLQAQSRTQSLTLWELTLNLPEGDHSMYVNAINSVECANVVGR